MKLHRLALCFALLWLLLSFPIAYWDWQGRWHANTSSSQYAFKLWLYWAQFAALPLLFALLLSRWRRLQRLYLYAKLLVCFGLALMIWAGQIEPNLIRIRNSTIPIIASTKLSTQASIKIALISDIHWGLFGRDLQLQRLVDRLNEQDVDAIFVAGDWTYEPKLDLKAGFTPLKELRAPIFAVLGNHDVEKPGPKLAKELRETLTANNVQFVEGKSIAWKGWEIIGLDDLWGGKPQDQIKTLFVQSAPNRIVLTHQPDTLALLPENSIQLGLAGHSHGGQIMLPYLTDWQLRTAMRQAWYNGQYDTPHGQVFVTSGIGMIGLPWRFLVPPTIDILRIEVK